MLWTISAHVAPYRQTRHLSTERILLSRSRQGIGSRGEPGRREEWHQAGPAAVDGPQHGQPQYGHHPVRLWHHSTPLSIRCIECSVGVVCSHWLYRRSIYMLVYRVAIFWYVRQYLCGSPIIIELTVLITKCIYCNYRYFQSTHMSMSPI